MRTRVEIGLTACLDRERPWETFQQILAFALPMPATSRLQRIRPAYLGITQTVQTVESLGYLVRHAHQPQCEKPHGEQSKQGLANGLSRDRLKWRNIIRSNVCLNVVTFRPKPAITALVHSSNRKPRRRRIGTTPGGNEPGADRRRHLGPATRAGGARAAGANGGPQGGQRTPPGARAPLPISGTPRPFESRGRATGCSGRGVVRVRRVPQAWRLQSMCVHH
jgi:hypothetical protein